MSITRFHKPIRGVVNGFAVTVDRGCLEFNLGRCGLIVAIYGDRSGEVFTNHNGRVAFWLNSDELEASTGIAFDQGCSAESFADAVFKLAQHNSMPVTRADLVGFDPWTIMVEFIGL